MILELLNTSKNVLILGFAREGLSTYRFLRAHYPHLNISIADQHIPDALPDDFQGQTFFGDHYLESLKGKDLKLVIKSPGISPHKPELIAARLSGTVFSSHTQIFFESCIGKIIGISGTKGKSTTSSLIYHVLSKNNVPSILVGNIGLPALDHLQDITKDTWVVMELSSYQLMTLSSSPHIAVLQNIFPDHLDYHTDLAEYISAKQNLVRYQSDNDYFLFNSDCKYSRQTASLTPAQKMPYSLSDFDKAIASNLLGDHNKYNIIPSVIIGELLGLSKENIYAAISTFSPLDTRLQLVASARGINFYADTLATIPEATIAAIDALGSGVTTLIAGGHERKQNYSELAKKILNSNINTLVLFPSTGQRIADELKQAQAFESEYRRPDAGNLPAGRHGDQAARETQSQMPSERSLKIYHVNSMPDAVNIALDHTASGNICLLSPAAPSFTLFKDYRDEHEQFKNCILAAAKK